MVKKRCVPAKRNKTGPFQKKVFIFSKTVRKEFIIEICLPVKDG